MDRADRRPNLAPAYQLALDLEAAGLSGDELAERLGVTAAALPSLLLVAHAKADTGKDLHADADGSNERRGN